VIPYLPDNYQLIAAPHFTPTPAPRRGSVATARAPATGASSHDPAIVSIRARGSCRPAGGELRSR